MAKPNEKSIPVSESEALEIIELASSDFEILAKAFELISEVIEESLPDRIDERQELERIVH